MAPTADGGRGCNEEKLGGKMAVDAEFVLPCGRAVVTSTDWPVAVDANTEDNTEGEA